MKITIEKSGAAEVSDAHEGRQNADGSHAMTRWGIRDADQLEKHARGLDAQPEGHKEAHPWARASKGDRDALRDAAHEIKKQRES